MSIRCSLKEKIPLSKDLVIGRNILPSNPIEKYKNCEIVGFSDGSSNAFGCVLYLRWASEDESDIEIKFLGAKGKVGPIGGNTIPRQELCGALLLSRLTSSVEKALVCTELKDTVTGTTLFTDSTTVLRWVNSEAVKYRPYVKNKVLEMQDLQPVKNWKYVSTTENKSADLISKGCDVKSLKLILKGPSILRESRASWNKSRILDNTDGSDIEEITCNAVATNEVDKIDVSKYNSFQKLKRITAYMLRWRYRIKANSRI